MTPTDLKQKLKEIIVEELNLMDITPEDIGDDDPLFGDKFGLDSIDAVELVYQIKTHLGIEIRDMKEGRNAFQTIRTLTDYLQERMKSA